MDNTRLFEHKTYENILMDALSRVPDTQDKREGSIIYDAIAPACYELALLYLDLQTVANKKSLQNSSEDDLTELCYQNGTFRKPATKALRLGEFNIDIPLGTLFNGGGVTFTVLDHIEDFKYKLECNQPGNIGNVYIGELTPDISIDGLEYALLSDIITPGVEEETDDQLRARHKRRLNEGEQNGNVHQYRIWAEEFEGIGAVKVFPLWNGGNTVKVAITDRLYHPAEQELVDSFQEYLDPNSEGLGNGVAPTGSKVTVTGGIQKDINIYGNIVLNEGYSDYEGVAENISKYLAGITYNKNSVSYMRTAVAILDSSSVFDLSDFTLNGSNEDVVLNDEEIPVLNSLNLTVVS